jgi:hypothetical protein
MTKQTVNEVLENVGLADPRVWVAGSAAIYPEKAEDIDLWVMKNAKLKPEAFDAELWAEKPQPPKESGYPSNPQITKRLELQLPQVLGSAPLKIQVMFTDFLGPMELLDTFDASCHAYARNAQGFLVVHPKATRPGSPIVRLKGSSSDWWITYSDEDFEKWYNNSVECCSSCKKNAEMFKNLRLQGDLTSKRIQEFTQRYADTTPDLLWLPA